MFLPSGFLLRGRSTFFAIKTSKGLTGATCDPFFDSSTVVFCFYSVFFKAWLNPSLTTRFFVGILAFLMDSELEEEEGDEEEDDEDEEEEGV